MSWRLRLLVETILRLTPAVLGSTVFSNRGTAAAADSATSQGAVPVHRVA
jgi:hypothetical protein